MILQKAGQDRIHVWLPGASTFCSWENKRFGGLVDIAKGQLTANLTSWKTPEKPVTCMLREKIFVHSWSSTLWYQVCEVLLAFIIAYRYTNTGPWFSLPAGSHMGSTGSSNITVRASFRHKAATHESEPAKCGVWQVRFYRKIFFITTSWCDVLCWLSLTKEKLSRFMPDKNTQLIRSSVILCLMMLASRQMTSCYLITCLPSNMSVFLNSCHIQSVIWLAHVGLDLKQPTFNSYFCILEFKPEINRNFVKT